MRGKTQRGLHRHIAGELEGNGQRTLVADLGFGAGQDPAVKARFYLVLNAEKGKAQRQDGRAHLAVAAGTLHVVGHPDIERDRLAFQQLFRDLARRLRSLRSYRPLAWLQQIAFVAPSVCLRIGHLAQDLVLALGKGPRHIAQIHPGVALPS